MTNGNKMTRGDDRRERGRTLFTKLLGYMLKEISHPEMTALADWALNEVGCLHTSQISHLKNAKMRMLGVKSLDSLGRINVAAWLHHNNQRKELQALGTDVATAKIEEILERYEPIMNPATDEPMDAGDLMMVYLGYIDLDLFVSEDVELDWSKVAENLTPWIEALLEERELRTREALALIKKSWPGTDATRDRFCLAVAGVDDLSAKEVQEMWAEITEGLKPLVDDDFSESDLYAMVTA